MLYEIINPSDPYTMKAEEFIDASLAIFLLGNAYAAAPLEDGGEDVPIFLLGGASEWFKRRFGIEAQAAYDQRKARVAEVLLSVVIGNERDRDMVDKTIALLPAEKREQWLDEYHDSKRSSVNDIGEYARKYGKAILQSIADDDDAEINRQTSGGGDE